MGFQGVWTSRRGQTKAKWTKYHLKIQKKNQKTDTPCCCYWNCLSVHNEAVEPQYEVEYHLFLLLPLINDGIQSSHKFHWSLMPWFYHFWLPFVYKSISCHFWSSFGQFWCQFFPKLSEIKPQYLWVLSPEGYGLLQLYGLWSVFPCKPTQWTEKPMRLKGVWGNWAMGYEGVNCTSNTIL